ncbi:MAG: hypothetical protein AAFQ80_21995 [Cyanobacteria bacterium J06621_8]
MIKALLLRFTTTIIATSLLIFIEVKFEAIDYLRFVNSTKTLEIDSGSNVIAYSPNGEMFAIAGGERIRAKIRPNSDVQGYSQVEVRRVTDGTLVKSWDYFSAK